jgi:hypothetical protein
MSPRLLLSAARCARVLFLWTCCACLAVFSADVVSISTNIASTKLKEETFQFFQTKLPISRGGRGQTAASGTYKIDGIEDGFREAFQMIKQVIGGNKRETNGIQYASLGVERNQGVSNARIARIKFMQLEMKRGVESVGLPPIRNHAINLDKLEGKKAKYSSFEGFYNADFFKETSEPLNLHIKFVTTTGGSLSSAAAWKINTNEYACHPTDPSQCKAGCQKDGDYARLAPLPLHLSGSGIRRLADAIETGLREAALGMPGGGGGGGARSPAFAAVHVRLEKDWTRWHAEGICYNGTEIARRTVYAARKDFCDFNDPCPIVIYVMGNAFSDFNITWPPNTRAFTKFDFISSSDVGNDAIGGLVDAEVSLRADVFVGTPRSGHSSMVFWDRHLLRKRSWRYERYTGDCGKYAASPMPEAERSDSAANACLYGAFRSQCLNMHCLTTGRSCNFSFPPSKAKGPAKASKTKTRERYDHKRSRSQARDGSTSTSPITALASRAKQEPVKSSSAATRERYKGKRSSQQARSVVSAPGQKTANIPYKKGAI